MTRTWRPWRKKALKSGCRFAPGQSTTRCWITLKYNYLFLSKFIVISALFNFGNLTFEPRTRKRESPLAQHIPVLFDEVLEFLRPRPGGRYLDGTVGLGGHALGIMEAAREAEVLGVDCDDAALEIAGNTLAPYADRVRLEKGRFSEFEAILDQAGWDLVDGALLDLGVSSLHLDTPERGFSFLADGPLDMRMDVSGGAAPAASLVNRASYHRLKEIILRYGEDPLAGRIARALVDSRDKNPVRTTLDLADRVSAAYPAKMRAKARNHPATRTFQALRMAVNRELEELKEFLKRIAGRMKPGARVVVVSFHSLEDRLVKWAFRDEAKGCLCPRDQVVCVCGHTATLKILTKKPITPSEDECAANPRARSAKLRAAERLGAQEAA